MADPIRLGMIDFDTSHAVEFTKRLNQLQTTPDQFVDGAKISFACPGSSRMAQSRIAEYTPAIKAMGVTLVDSPKDLLGKVDGMLIESLEGEMHLEKARPFLQAGIPCFIDKPFSGSVDTAKTILELSAKHNAPVFSSSSLRFVPELVQICRSNSPSGAAVGAFAHGPSPFHEPPKGEPQRNPGLYHYGIHPVEVLYTIMGKGCVEVVNLRTQGADMATGRWKDGRTATIRGIRQGVAPYGCTRFGMKGTESLTLSTKYIYRELLKQVVAFFRDRKSPVDPLETLEIIAFIEAANQSGDNHGRVQPLASLS